jgi:predicted nucleic acid-binding protein
MIHLDTSFLIHALMPDSFGGEALKSWLRDEAEVNISSIALSEFLCGPLTMDEQTLVEYLFPSPEPFVATDASRAAELFNLTGRRSRSLADCQIAAVALRCGARIATGNVSDFAPFADQGLELASVSDLGANQ